jgi:hypothetical protein
VPQPTFGANGFILPTENAVLTGVLADHTAAFGPAMNTALSTPQGQLATSEAAALSDTYALFLELINGIDPSYSSGRMQDGIGRLYFMDRVPSRPTVSDILCTGAVGLIIPTGAIVRSPADGNLYTCTGGGTVGATGSILLQFACNTNGPVAAPAQTWQIYSNLPGWDTAVSSAPGTIGCLVETPQAFEARRAASVALNANNTLDAIRANVLACAGVLDCYIAENNTGNPATISGVPMLEHSVYISVVGGQAADIAAAINKKKSVGCSYNGNTTIVVRDTTGYVVPYPSYPITFEIPTPTTVYIAVTIAAGTLGIPANALALIQAAVMKAFVGADGGARAAIGSTLYAQRYYNAVAALGSWAQVVVIQIGTAANPTGYSVTLPISQSPVTGPASISLAFV